MTETTSIEDIDLTLATLKITNNGIKTELTRKNGRKIYKNIGLESLTKVLNKNLEFDTGFMPLFGSNYIGTKRFIKSGDKEILFLEACPTNRKLSYENKDVDYKAVRYPGLLMSVVCRSKPSGKIKVTDTRLFATTGPILRDQDSLFKFPFGNVYQDNIGKICWGDLDSTVRYIKKISQAAGLLNMFLDATMNDDLYRSIDGSTLINFIENLDNNITFRYDLLKKEMTFKELISLIKSKNVG